MGAWLQTILRDLRHGVRTLRRAPAFTAVAALSLALGIGANTAIFSVVRATLLRPLPYSDPARLIVLEGARSNFPRMPFSPADVLAYAARARSIDQLATAREINPTLTARGVPAERVRCAIVTANFFSLLGVPPAIGRSFLPDDGLAGAPRVALVDDGFWRSRYGADPGAIGRDMILDGVRVTIVGVLPRTFVGPVNVSIWVNPRTVVPEFSLTDPTDPRTIRGTRYLNFVVGRLNPGVALADARGDFAGIATRLQQENPNDAGISVNVMSLGDAVSGDLRLTLLILFAVVGVVLLIACVNVANLLMARAASRQREIAVRTALGAGRLRIASQLAAESLLLAAAGAALGLGLASGALRVFAVMQAAVLPRTAAVRLDLPVLLYTLGIALATGVLFGFVPAMLASRMSLSQAMAESGRGAVAGGLGHARLRSALVVGEIALSLVLLIAAGLLLRSFMGLLRVQPGFQPDRLETMWINFTGAKYEDDARSLRFLDQLLPRVQGLPGVEAIGISSDLPLTRTDLKNELQNLPGSALSPNEVLLVGVHPVNPGYFRAMGIPLLRGREFTDQDRSKSRPVVVVNQKAAERLWPGQAAVGKPLRVATGQMAEVVGVVGNVLHNGLVEGATVDTYLPLEQFPWPYIALSIRTRDNSLAFVSAVRRIVSELDPDLPVYDVRSMAAVLSDSIAERRWTLDLIGTFAVLALALAMVGIYGVMTYAVTQRTPELGVRIALGARPGHVLRMILGGGLRLASAGIAIGLVVSWVVARLLRGLLFNVTATDAATFLEVPLLLLAVVLLACYIPARRASRVDPLTALRDE